MLALDGVEDTTSDLAAYNSRRSAPILVFARMLWAMLLLLYTKHSEKLRWTTVAGS